MRPLIAGNWKMNTDLKQGVDLVLKIRDLVKGCGSVDCVIAPPFTAIHHLSHLLADSGIELGAQDIFWEKSGAYTGEVSGEMLVSVGCKHVIIGHSERRQFFGETDETVNKKVLAALRHGLKPIMCVGESLDEREAGKTIKTVCSQVTRGLTGLSGSALRDITVAYEPLWAIGTGRTASPQQAEEVHNSIRGLLYELFDAATVKETRIIYGGSVKADNIDELMAQPNIDGALVGGASLKAEDFARIVKFQPT